MKLRTLLSIATLAVTVSACESAPHNKSFAATSPSALIVLAGPVNGSENTDVFRHVDLSANRFTGDALRIVVSTYGMLSAMNAGSNQINVSDSAKTVALAIQEVPPGDYAWVEYSRTAGSSVYGLVMGGCLNENAPVFSVAAGEIAILRIDGIALESAGPGKSRRRPLSEAPSDDSVLAQFEKARLDYPSIVGPVKVLQPIAAIRWEQAQANHFEGRGCGEPPTFERIGSR